MTYKEILIHVLYIRTAVYLKLGAIIYSDITKQESVKDLILIRLIRTDEFKFLTNWITGKTDNINVVFIFQCTVKYVANNKRACPPASLKRRTLTVRMSPLNPQNM